MGRNLFNAIRKQRARAHEKSQTHKFTRFFQKPPELTSLLQHEPESCKRGLFPTFRRKNSEQIYEHVKRSGSHSVGVQDFSFNRELVADDAVKSRLFNGYFYSVFLARGALSQPAARSICDKMPPFEVSTSGIERLMKILIRQWRTYLMKFLIQY